MNKNKKNNNNEMNKKVDMNTRINYTQLNSGIDTSKAIDNKSKGKNE